METSFFKALSVVLSNATLFEREVPFEYGGLSFVVDATPFYLRVTHQSPLWRKESCELWIRSVEDSDIDACIKHGCTDIQSELSSAEVNLAIKEKAQAMLMLAEFMDEIDSANKIVVTDLFGRLLKEDVAEMRRVTKKEWRSFNRLLIR